MLDYIIMVLAKARSQEILTPSLHSKPHHHLGLVERRFRPDSSRCARGQINCHPKNLLCWKAAKGLQAGWLKPRIAILFAQTAQYPPEKDFSVRLNIVNISLALSEELPAWRAFWMGELHSNRCGAPVV